MSFAEGQKILKNLGFDVTTYQEKKYNPGPSNRITQRYRRIDGKPVGQFTNGPVPVYVEIPLIETTPDQMPGIEKAAQFHTRQSKKQAHRHRMYFVKQKGKSKYPYGQMAVGNSFFIELLEETEEEVERIRSCITSSYTHFIEQGLLDPEFKLSSIYSVKNGVRGLAFFRTR